MSKLYHKPSAYLRYLQLSATQLFIFVEGKISDPYFYGSICKLVCSSNHISFRTCLANVLPSSSGGKDTLLDFHDYLSQKNALVSIFKGKKTGVFFFIDKDIDDITNRLRKSSHIKYTKFYDVQNHIYLHGDLHKGVASATSLCPTQVEPLIGNPDAWREKAFLSWREWIELCILSKIADASCISNFSVKSRINDNQYGSVNLKTKASMLKEIKNRSGLSSVQIEKEYRKIKKLISTLLRQRKFDLVFKGKWYAGFLANTVYKAIGNCESYDSKGLEAKLDSCIALTLNFDSAWSNYFKKPLETLCLKLQ
jgi:hypothetical protein